MTDIVGQRLRSSVADLEAALEAAPNSSRYLVVRAIAFVAEAAVLWESAGMPDFKPPARLEPSIAKTFSMMVIHEDSHDLTDAEIVDRLEALDIDSETHETIVAWVAVARQRLGAEHPARQRVLAKLRKRAEREVPEDEQDPEAFVRATMNSIELV